MVNNIWREYTFALTVLARNARKLIPCEIKVYYTILKFVDLIAYKTLIVMFEVKNNVLQIPKGIQSLFTINSDSYNTRQSGKF